MAREISLIKALENKETFWEDVRHIIGYYEHRIWTNSEIKRLQRIADARFEEIGG